MEQIKVGMIGAGETGTPLLRQLLDAPFVVMVGVADLNLDSPGILLAQQRGISVTDNFIELAEQGRAAASTSSST
ncbi:hypothetical protein JOS77_20945 [Chromobacterium haemolyticum]|nr:hypothetical protein JOS77_20945 [Chromobacterium haemolyticum]